MMWKKPWPTINDIVDCSYTIHASFNPALIKAMIYLNPMLENSVNLLLSCVLNF